MRVSSLTTIISLVFSPLPALAAFLITYKEYSHHYPDNRRQAFKIALKTALVTLAVFIILAIGIGLYLPRVIPT